MRKKIGDFIPPDPEDETDVGQGLDYQNLFEVCSGNTRWHLKGTRRPSLESLICDKHRGNVMFKRINPLKSETLETIYYHLDGKIGDTDPDVEYDLIETLNLNCPVSPIVSERKAALDTLINGVGAVEDELLNDYCTKLLSAFKEEKDKKTPFAGVLIWYLRSMVTALS